MDFANLASLKVNLSFDLCFCREGREFLEAASCLQYPNKKCILSAECTPRKSKVRFVNVLLKKQQKTEKTATHLEIRNLAFDFLGVHSAVKMHFLLEYCKQLAASENSLPSLQLIVSMK